MGTLQILSLIKLCKQKLREIKERDGVIPSEFSEMDNNGVMGSGNIDHKITRLQEIIEMFQ